MGSKKEKKDKKDKKSKKSKKDKKSSKSSKRTSSRQENHATLSNLLSYSLLEKPQLMTDLPMISKSLDDGEYVDIKGLCKVSTLSEIEEQGHSLNPGRYVGVADEDDDGVDFHERLSELNIELEKLNAEAKILGKLIGHNIEELLEWCLNGLKLD